MLAHARHALETHAAAAASMDLEHSTLRAIDASLRGGGGVAVVHGPLGCGKTSLCAAIAARARLVLPSGVTTVVRFAGLTPATRTLASLLASVVRQLHAANRGGELPEGDSVPATWACWLDCASSDRLAALAKSVLESAGVVWVGGGVGGEWEGFTTALRRPLIA
jgi:hypothetical protein